MSILRSSALRATLAVCLSAGWLGAPNVEAASDPGHGYEVAPAGWPQSAPLTTAPGTRVITLTASQDAYISQASPNTNYGLLNTVRVAVINDFLEEHRTLLQFPVEVVPQGANILAARMRLQLSDADAGAPVIEAHRVTAAWSPTTTWNSAPGFSSFVYATRTVPASTNTFYDWDLTLLVQRWVNLPNSFPNHGVALKTASAFEFFREFRSADVVTATLRPQLVVTYSLPVRAYLPNTMRVAPASWGPPSPDPCAHKTNLGPWVDNSWAFVLNFEVASGSPPTQTLGCLLAFGAVPQLGPQKIVVPCAVLGPVAISGGDATFNGGHVQCPMNIRASLGALAPPIPLAPVEAYDRFTMLGYGALSIVITSVAPLANPVAYYAPMSVAQPVAAMFVPLLTAGSPTTTQATIASQLNGLSHPGSAPFLTSSATKQAWMVRQDGGQTTHLVEMTVTQVYSGTAPVQFFNDGGTLFVGHSGVGPPLLGLLDEIVIDPNDYTEPPQ